MSQDHRFCTDRIPPDEIPRMRMVVRHVPDGLHIARAIAPINKMWPNGSTLRIRFMGGTSAMHEKVMGWANQWTEHANLTFEKSDEEDAEIRVGFVQGDGSWSAVGTDALKRHWFPLTDRTMNFGWELEEGTVLHEFGHAIGLGHEHQNPEGGIEWDEQAVIRSLSGPPNNWSPEQIRHNVLRKYDEDEINGTEFDPESVMLYFFPVSWTLNGVATKSNDDLSEVDKSFIGTIYPKDPAPPNDVEINGPAVEASIGEPGEEDQFRFTIAEAGFYSIETEGNTDVVMRLYGPDSETALIAEDDDGGQSYNAKIARDLEPGNYMVQIRHYWSRWGTGDYKLKITS